MNLEEAAKTGFIASNGKVYGQADGQIQIVLFDEASNEVHISLEADEASRFCDAIAVAVREVIFAREAAARAEVLP